MTTAIETLEATEIEVSQELQIVLHDSGLELTEAEQIKQSYLPFFIELSEIKKASKKISFENPTELDEKIARELRIKTMKVRTRSEEIKENRKKIHMLKANVEQSAWNLIRDTCKLEEEHFTSVEKRRELIEKARQEAVRVERVNELQPYSEFVPVGIDLARMAGEDYAKFLNGAKLQYEAKQEAIRKSELERIERERVQLLHNERKNLLLNDWQFVPDEYRADNLGLYNDSQWEQINHLVSRSKVAYQKEQERIRIENEKLKAEKEAAEKLAAEQKAKADAERKVMEEKARKEREEAAAKLKAEQEANAKLEAELKAKADAERKAKEEVEAKAKAEEAARIKAEKKAAAAPDKEKLLNWANHHLLSNIPTDLKTDEANNLRKRASKLVMDAVELIRIESEGL
jgi:hypothetical protein